MNLLQEQFNQNPPDEIVKEFPIGSGVKYIGIRDIKRLLNENFYKWSTSNLKVQYIQRGHDFLVSGSIELNVDYRVYLENNVHPDDLLIHETYTFIGANTFNVKTEQAEGNNENYEAILLANCIKNASKNIGNLFGANLNTIDEYLPTYTDVKSEPTKPNIKKTITKIIKDKS
jgi:hypothetical protein